MNWTCWNIRISMVRSYGVWILSIKLKVVGKSDGTGWEMNIWTGSSLFTYAIFGLIVSNRAIVYNFLKVVVHLSTIDQCNRTMHLNEIQARLFTVALFLSLWCQCQLKRIICKNLDENIWEDENIWDIGEQCRLRSDTTECGIWSESALFALISGS